MRDWCSGSSFSRLPVARDYPSGKTAVEYEFRHWLYRDVLYRRLNPASRVGFHRRLAESFEALGPMVQSEMAAEIALHFEEGHEYERAVHYLLLTAKTAARRYAHGQVVAILEHARPAVAENPAATANGARPADSREDGQRLLCARRDGPGRRRLRLDGDACCGRGASGRAGRGPDASGAPGRVDSFLPARRRDRPALRGRIRRAVAHLQQPRGDGTRENLREACLRLPGSVRRARAPVVDRLPAPLRGDRRSGERDGDIGGSGNNRFHSNSNR